MGVAEMRMNMHVCHPRQRLGVNCGGCVNMLRHTLFGHLTGLAALPTSVSAVMLGSSSWASASSIMLAAASVLEFVGRSS